MTDKKPVSSGLLWGARVLVFGALAVSGYLLYHSLSGGGAMAGCGADTAFDCESVLNSKWSKVGPVPSSALAIAIYLITLGSLNGLRRPNAQLAQLLAGLCAMSIIGAGVWFTVLQFVILKKICIWCMTAHVFGLLGGLLVLVLIPWNKRFLSLVGLLPVVAMLSLQINTKAVTHTVQVIDTDNKAPAAISSKQVLLMGNRVAINPSKHPLLGSPDAKEFLMYLFDYTCPHCRALHGNLQQAVARYGDQLAIIALPMPLNSDCNPAVAKTEERHKDACSLAILALAVYHALPDKFSEFDRWLIETVSDAQAARVKAIELFGSEAALNQAIADPWVAKELERNIGLYQHAGGGVVPKLMGKNTLIAGRPGDVLDLYDLLEDELGLVPVESVLPTGK
ncbi:MAG TPA: hypothetical protein DCM28_17585 [Phycisphaerales bacterium]|nr:hypothetical protein [Phycisphaerales bacterium]HCD35130.1 hypothetical protein [Phycisphaerales bacterium]|tara:strand:- start:607 stop:1791 length:1185 start_codon:yes stop_codon:yes gene_type:complete